ncbi:MAG TPA: M23 family metallopeptidase [Longimicrobiales bacterium]|nr:M23 family metallopeptidase [Longimicrobiales bacterium]
MRVRRALLSLLLCAGATGCAIPRWPVDAPMTSAFGLRFRGLRPEVHRGVDLSVPEGTEVRAMAPGRVRFAGFQRGYGNVVWLDHGGEVITVYAHLSTLLVRTGEKVEGHAVVGLSGSTGDARGAHLHFEVWRWGREVDPVPLLGGRPGGQALRTSP